MNESTTDNAKLSRVFADGAWVAVAQLVSVVAAVWFSIVSARTLGVDGFASLIWVLSVALFLGAVARFGSMQSAARIVSLSAGNTRVAIIRLFVGPLLFGLAASALWLVWLGGFLVERSNNPELYGQVDALVAIWLPTATLFPVVAATLRAIGAFKESTLFNEGLRRITMSLVLLSVASAVPSELVRITVIVVVVVEALAIAVGFFLALRLTERGLDTERDPDTEVRPYAKDFTESLGFWPTSVVALVLPQSGGWILAIVAVSQEVADFGLALQVSMLFSLPFVIGSRVYVPRIARSHVSGTLERLEVGLRSFATASLGAIGVGILVFAIVGQWLVEAVFGAAFSGAYVVTLVLSVGAVANASTGLCMAVLANSGSARVVAWSSVVAAAVFVPATLVLGARFGATGAALAASTTQVLWNAVMVNVSTTRTGIRTSATLRPTKQRPSEADPTSRSMA